MNDRQLMPIQTELSDLVEHARDYVSQAKADNTLKAYRSDWADFSTWCASRGQVNLPSSPSTVVLYLTALIAAGRKTATLQRRISAISQAHQAAGEDNPTRGAEVKALMGGIRRVHGTAQTGKAPAVIEDIRRMVAPPRFTPGRP